jgi:nucleotide-binding universal stress UspA family protein
MSFKTILSIIGVNDGDTDVIEAAELCERINAHLNVVAISCAPPMPFGDDASGAYSTWSLDWETENNRLAGRTAELSGLLKSKGFQGDIQPLYCLRATVNEEIGLRARYADVCVIGTSILKDDFLRTRVLDGTLFHSPAPVILAPNAGPIDLSPKTIIVAWDAGLESGRAVRRAMEMLIGAENVHIVLVDPQATPDAMGQEPGADIATMLARHGVNTTVDILSSGGHEIGKVIRQHAVDINAGLIVMGAYGHSRLRERIFGGVTNSMIENPGIPLMLAH